ncbi:MAG: hypothetical protein LBI45_08350 [Bacteroidales bacterium]|jgi:hypothetical protein|nr:hypothetical protein [Bacteroidales bacterium]
MKITSPTTRIILPAPKIFELTSNLQNFHRYMSNQVKDISATADSCSFTVENIAQITLKILEKTAFSQIRFAADNDKNIPLLLTLNMNAVSENETDVIVDMDIEIPIFLKPLIQKPLERFVETLLQKIKNEVEKSSL